MAIWLVESQSDEELVDAARAGDQDAVALLWERHAPAGRRAARAVTTAFDADDLVSEAFASILHAIRNGHGPRGPFRPYLFRAIRNVAAEWGGKNREVLIEDMSDILDRSGRHADADSHGDAVVAAFKQVPERWRTLLWYMEVEGMRPREIAPLMGMTPNSVSALAVRARQGFKKAWLEAIVASGERPAECRWVCDRIVRTGSKAVARRDSSRYDSHLAECQECRLILAEANGMSGTLRMVLLPLIIGGTAAVALSAEMAAPAAALGVGAGLGAASKTSWFGPGTVAAGAGVAATAAAALLAAGMFGSTQGPAPAPQAALNHSSRPSTTPTSSKARPKPTQATSSPAAIGQTAAPAAPPATAEPVVAADPTFAPSGAMTRPPVDTVPPARPSAPPSSMTPSPSSPAPATPSAPIAIPFFEMQQFNQPVPPLMQGWGTPGATIRILDESGAVLADTVVGVDGGFGADVSGDLLHQGMSLVLEQTTPGGTPEAVDPLGPFDFPVPTIDSVRGALPVHLMDADADGELDDAPVSIRGIAGEAVQIVMDGLVGPTVAMDAASMTVYLLDAPTGSQALSLRYIDPATARLGVAADPIQYVVGGAGSVTPDSPVVEDPAAPVTEDPAPPVTEDPASSVAPTPAVPEVSDPVVADLGASIATPAVGSEGEPTVP